jgi:pectinesterase
MKFLNSTLPALAALLIAVGCSGQPTMAAGKILTVGPKGQYKTIQAAIDAAPTHSRKPIVINIAPGTYKELVTIPSDDSNIILKGTSAKETIITYNLGARDKGANGKEIGTFHTPTVTILGRNITAEHLTFKNSYGKGSQAVAVRTGDGPVVFRHCRFLAWQDTLYVHNPHAKIYLTHCLVQGAVDFIFGEARAVFNHCVIRSVGSACVTAPNTPRRQRYGLVFLHCRITASKNVRHGSVYLGRPWRAYGSSTFIDCHMAADVAPAGWLNWQGTKYYKTARFSEYHSTGPGADAKARVKWSHQLTKAQAATYTVKAILGAGPWLKH